MTNRLSPLILLHGGGQGSWIWDETIAALRLQDGGARRNLLALDIPGCGTKRKVATDAIGVGEIVSELIADIEAAAFHDAVLVGHSQAGTILPLLAAARPDLFRHLIYISCLAPIGDQNGFNWRHTMPEAGSAIFDGHEQDSRDFFRAIFCNDMEEEEGELFLDKLGRDAWPASCYAICAWDYTHLRETPSTYIQLLRDKALPPPWQSIFAERLHAKDIIRIDTGHQVMNRRPHSLAEILRSIADR